MIGNILVSSVALLQTYFLVLEMFLWTTPKVRRTFGMTEDFARATFSLAKNQGLYNGFLAAGLVWGLIAQDPVIAFQAKVFFLSCVLVAGLFGAITVSRKILFVQALPAAVALISVLRV